MSHAGGTERDRLRRVADVAAIIIAVASLAITLYEARATREHDRVSVWPRLSQQSSDSAGRYDRTITNVGLGPALIRSFQVRVDNHLQQSWAPVVAALVANNTNPGYFFSSVGPGTVILPGHTLHVLTVAAGNQTSTIIAQDRRVTSRICYCSLYDECWISTTQRADPEPVARCAASDTASMEH